MGFFFFPVFKKPQKTKSDYWSRGQKFSKLMWVIQGLPVTVIQRHCLVWECWVRMLGHFYLCFVHQLRYSNPNFSHERSDYTVIGRGSSQSGEREWMWECKQTWWESESLIFAISYKVFRCGEFFLSEQLRQLFVFRFF